MAGAQGYLECQAGGLTPGARADNSAGGRKPLWTRSRMVGAAVCQPLAARAPKNEPRAASSSRWNGCGSNWAASALIPAVSTRSVPDTCFCPGSKSSR
jgi:hypothetical protein